MSKPSSNRASGLVVGLISSRRMLMLAGVSAVALMAATPRVEARMLGMASGTAPVSAQAAALAAAQAAAKQASQQAIGSIKRATSALQAIQQLQQQARNAAMQSPSSVPNGLVSGGLEPDAGFDSNGKPSPTWTGIGAIGQAQNGSETDVDILQTQSRAILNWKTFNVGANTVVQFIQNDGVSDRSDWVALNRIGDASPSKILGQIRAPGMILLINGNGIIFGGGSQINVGSLIASTLDVGSLGMTRAQRDEVFLGSGLTSSSGFSVSSTPNGGDANTKQQGDIEVDAGAVITTSIGAQDSPGSVFLFGANVTNNGTIISPEGEVAMVAARTIVLTPQQYRSGVLPAAETNFRGTGFIFTQYASSYDTNGNPLTQKYLPGTGAVSQGGLIGTPLGTALLTGDTINMSGVISADTSVSRNGNILLDAVTSVNVSGTLSIQPFENGETLPFLNGTAASAAGSNVQGLVPGFVFMGGYDVVLASSGLISAPSATVTLQASTISNQFTPTQTFNMSPNVDQTAVPQRVLLAPGATIDVAGLQDVQVPAANNFIAYVPQNTDFADFPLLRNGPLVGQTLWIDIRAHGTRADGSTWFGTPLGNANPFVDNVPQSLDVLMTKGGTVNLNTDTTGNAGLHNVVTQSGSLINTAGGFVQYLPGKVPVTVLIGANGRRYTMANADPNIAYVGIAGQFTVFHDPSRYKVTEVYSSPFYQRNEPGYVEGRDAGGVSITTVIPVLEGDFLFGSISGERQIANGQQASNTLANGAPSQNTPYELPSQGFFQLTTAASVVIDDGSSSTALPPNFNVTTPLPQGPFDPLPTDLFKSAAPARVDLSAARFSGLSALIITSSDLVLTKGSEIDTALGGRVLFETAGAMDLQGRIVAHSGQISLNTDGFDLSSKGLKVSLAPSGTANIADIRISGVLDTSGIWVNDTGLTTPGTGTGSAFINGGNISISTNSNTGLSGDDTGSIILNATAVLDADSGGYVGVNGKLMTSAFQVPAGTGGNITLAVYQGTGLSTDSGHPLADAGKEKDANVLIDPAAVMHAYGFTNNGQLLIAAPLAIQIGGQSNNGANLWLPDSLFSAGAFSSYTVQSVADGRLNNDLLTPANSTSITLAAGDTLNLVQRNFSLNGATPEDLPTGTDISQVASVVTLPVDQRAPTRLTLGSDNILLDKGSSINADPDPQATAASPTVTLRGTQIAGTTPITYNKAISALLLGQIVSHGGTVNISANHIWLGGNAVIDVSGTFVPSSTFNQGAGSANVSGKLLAGGSVNFDASLATPSGTQSNDYLVAQSGAVVNVSGAHATLEGTSSSSAPVDSWSDGGTVSITTPVLLWDGTFLAKAGAPQGNDGTLIVGGGQVYLSQSVTTTPGASLHAVLAGLSTPTSATALGNTLDPSLAPLVTQLANSSTNGALHLTVDKLSQFGTIFVYSGLGMKPGEYFSILDPTATKTNGAVPLALNTVGNINWNVSQRLYLGAQAIVANSPATASTVNISAPYVLLTSYGQSTASATAGAASLTVQGNTIDVEGAVFSGFASVSLNSSGDIRLSTPRVFDNSPDGSPNPNSFPGSITTLANLSLQAQRTYPVTKVDFTIQAPNVTFSAPAGSDTTVPLSAGGSVTVLATGAINQDGNLFAPQGKITLGDSTAQSVTLGPGSLTSVALGGTVPFGTTEDGTNWFYNDSTNPMTLTPGSSDFLPTKVITVNGASVSLQSTSTVDVSGGGDLQANEFVAGKGGSVDTLVTRPGGPTVYALLPSNSAAVAAFDIDFAYRLGDVQPLAGKQIYLSGGNGIAAGTYTLLPSHYATLPGAMRVVDYGSALAKPGAAGHTLTDGTQIIAGFNTQSTNPGGRSSGTELFAVQTNAVWRQYSEIDAISANAYFVAKAVHDGVNVPYLPMDAGRLAISAQTQLTMHETARDQAQPGGRPGQLDLSANQIDLIGPGQTAPAGFLGIDVTQINGFDSVLIGGLRTDRADGSTLITATASEVMVDTQGAALTAPELILIAAPSVGTTTVTQTFTISGVPVPFNFNLTGVLSGPATAGTGNIVVNSGSVINSTGLTGNSFARNYVTSATAADLAAALGGTLSADGTQITGASITKLQNALATHDPVILGMLRNYSGAKGFGAMLAMTNDPLLSVGAFSGQNSGPLTISFVNAGTLGTPVPQKLVLPGSNSNNGGANPNPGSVTINANAALNAKSIIISATADIGAIAVSSGARLGTTQLSLIAKNFAFDDSAAASAAVVMTRGVFDQLADGRFLSLKSFGGGMDFFGNIALDSQRTSLGVTLDAAWLAGHGGSPSIGSGGTVTFQNTGASGTTTQATVARTTLSVNADEVDFGGGSQTIAGFATVALNADTRVFARKSGSLTLGADGTAVNLTMTTPELLVGAGTASGAGSQFLITTLGNVSVARPSGAAAKPSATTENGGSLEIDAHSFTLSGTIQVQAGTLVIHTTGTDPGGVYGITLTDGAYIAAGGFLQNFFDVVQDLPGGKVTLTADAGSVFTAAGSTIDLAQPDGGQGYGGEFDVTATAGNAQLNGAYNGAGGVGHGGTFRVDALALGDPRQAQDPNALNVLADQLLAGGMSNLIDIHTHSGNLTLSAGHTLQAHTISITADTLAGADPTANGNLTIAGTIDARGEDATTSDGVNQAGGQVGLWGVNTVTLQAGGQILASTSHADERGGDVTIGVSWNAAWNASTHVGGINLVSGSLIDVSGGTKGGLSGGTVTLRAPNDGNNDVKIQAIGSTIKGARAVDVEDFLSIDTVPNSSKGIDGSTLASGAVWDGVIDPLGWFNSNGTLVNGNFTNVSGYKLTITAGTGYTSVPTVAVTGSTATVVASLKVVSFSGSGGEYTSVPTVTFTVPANSGLANGGTQAAATVNAGLKTITVANGPTGIANGATVTIAGGGGTGATGTAIVTNGVLTGVTITAAGSNFTGAPTSLTVGGKTVTAGIFAHFTINSVSVSNAGEGYTGVATFSVSGGTTIAAATLGGPSMGLAVTVTAPGSSTPTFTVSGGGFSTTASISVATSTALTGSINSAVNNGAFTLSTTFAGFNVLDTNGVTNGAGLATFAPTAVNTAHTLFYGTYLESYVEGNLAGFGFSNAQARLATYQLSDGTKGSVNVQPGLDLINSSTSKNNGDITVASNWNLAAGNAFASNGITKLATTNTYNPTDPINFFYRLGIQPGTLNLRAVRNVNINASISDGFFQFNNYLDPTYNSNLVSYLKGLQTAEAWRGIGEANSSTFFDYYLNGLNVPVVHYSTTANGISPKGSELAAADVFPSTLLFCISNCGTASAVLRTVQNPGSWSYRITAGADVASANPNATGSAFGVDASAANRANGSVIIGQHGSYNQPALLVSSGLLTATNVVVNLPTMVRTGIGGIDVTAALNLQLTDQLAPGVIYTAGVNTAPLPDAGLSLTGTGANINLTASNPAGFFQPQILLANVKTAIFGPENAAAFPQMGGDVTIDVRQDVIGFQNVKNSAQASSTQAFAQFYAPWLFSMAKIGLQTGASDILKLGSGVFQGSGIASNNVVAQSAWWIQFGSFDQGVMSVGGNVTLTAGRDVKDFSLSLPTTGRVSGGLSQLLPNGQPNTPVLHFYGSGNMTVNVGRELDSGSFYEGSGHASIQVRGSVSSDWQANLGTTAAPIIVPAATVLAVDSGQITLNAGGSISTSVVNPAAIRKQFLDAFSNAVPYEMQTYGPDSAVRLLAGGGDVNLLVNPFPLAANLYPASLDVVAFTGSIKTAGNITLADSPNGTLDLLAANNISLGGGISTGASLIDQAFDAYAPNNGFDAGSSDPLLAHRGDHRLNHVYAVNGTIKSTVAPVAPATVVPLATAIASRLESNRPIAVRAGVDIIDINLVAQNLNIDDVSSVMAGRDISYTGALNAGGLEIAGPGFLMVQAGRDLGPFLPLAHDTSTQAVLPQGIESVGNNGILNIELGAANPVAFPVGNEPNSFAPPNPEFLGLPASSTCTTPCWVGSRNFQLPTTGASVTALFGVAKGVNYQGIIDTYVDPAGAANVPHNYLHELRKYLASLGISTANDADAWSKFGTLSQQLRQIFADQVYFAELDSTTIPNTPSFHDYQRGYQAVNIMFPADVSAQGLYGYTRNNLGGGSNGANALVQTGNLNLLHGTIQTQKGGDISILGPGGEILAGSVATEQNPKLKLNFLGILTLAGGGINTFTDESVLVNASRVMTWFGGDIVMWSSNGDLDAGRGARTTLSFPPLSVVFDPDDIETVDLGGAVSGAGIAVLRKPSSGITPTVDLAAPRGTVNAGDAGIRSAGTVNIAALHVVNAGNITAAGAVTGVPTVQAPPVASLTAANSAAVAAKPKALTADAPTERPSVIIVEVLGYGGGDKPDQPSPANRGDDTDENGQKRNKPNQSDDHQSYDPKGNVRVLGYSTLGEPEMTGLTEKEKQAIKN